jgi:hypothetical protein
LAEHGDGEEQTTCLKRIAVTCARYVPNPRINKEQVAIAGVPAEEESLPLNSSRVHAEPGIRRAGFPAIARAKGRALITGYYPLSFGALQAFAGTKMSRPLLAMKSVACRKGHLAAF